MLSTQWAFVRYSPLLSTIQNEGLVLSSGTIRCGFFGKESLFGFCFLMHIHSDLSLPQFEHASIDPPSYSPQKSSFEEKKHNFSITNKSLETLRSQESPCSTTFPVSDRKDALLNIPTVVDDEFQHTEELAGVSSWSDFFYLFHFSDIPLIFGTLIFTCLSAALEPLMTWTTGKVFDALSQYATSQITLGKMISLINFNCLLITIFGLASCVFSFGVRFLWQYLSAIAGKRARSLCFHVLSSKSSTFYSLTESKSGLVNSVDRCIQFYEKSISLPMFHIAENLAISLSCLIISFRYSWSLTLVVLASYPIIILVVGFINSFLSSAYEKDRKSSEKAASILEKSISAIQTVIFHSMQDTEYRYFADACSTSSKSFLRFSFLDAFQGGVSQFFLYSVFFQGLWFGNHLATTKRVNVGQVVTVFGSCLSVASSLQQILPAIPDLIKGKFSSHFIKTLCESHDPIEAAKRSAAKIKSISFERGFRFDNVSFAYPSRDENLFSLINVSVFIPFGELVHIIGPSGSGKSTFISLLLRYFSPTYGNIYLDDFPLEEIDEHVLGSTITLVCQQPVIFDMTIRENIIMRNENASESDFEEVCRLALVDEFALTFDQSYDTPCKEASLSGGQQQRIALARALLRDTEILILDEPTSALDPITKNLVMDAIRAHRKGKTTLVITHDMSQINNDELVLVIDKGHLIQRCARKELVLFEDFENNVSIDEKVLKEEADNPFILPNEESLLEKYWINYNESFSQLSRESLFTSLESPFTDIESPTIVSRRKIVEQRKLRMEKEAFQETNVDQTFHLFDDKEHACSLTLIFKSIWKVKKLRWFFLLGLLTSLIQGASVPIFAYVISKCLNLFMQIDPSIGVAFWSSMVLVVAAGSGASYFFSHYIFSISAKIWCDHYRLLAVKVLFTQDQAWFDQIENYPLVLSKILVNNISDMRNMISSLIEEVFIAFTMAIIGIAWSFATGWRLAAVLVAVSPILCLTSRMFSYIYVSTERMCQDVVISTTSILHKTIVNLDTIKGYSVLSFFRENHKNSLRKSWEAFKRRAFWTSLGFAINNSLLYFVRALLFYCSSIFISKEFYSVEQMVQVLSLATFTLLMASTCIMSLPNVSASRIATSRVLKLSSLKPGNLHKSGYLKFPLVGKIEFDGVSFAYPDSERNHLALNNVSLSIEAREKVAIVGISGSGKSTLVELLRKTYPSEDIYIDGYPLTNIDTNWLLKKVAIVDQKPHLLGSTILESLLYGVDRDINSVMDVLDKTYMTEVIQNLPNGLDTPLLEFSKNFSGGQIQRLAFARALLRNPRLLILDECTSALDSKSSLLLEKTIQSLSCTVLIITHQPSLMKLADRIIVMDSGIVKESGSFDELMNRHTHFWKLIHRGEWIE